jgi:protein O-mannosyl-transferase
VPRLFGASAVALAVVLVYARELDAPFVFDDLSAIADNANLRQLATAFSTPADTALSGRPLVHASFALTYALAGLEPAPYRAGNLALHLVNALLLWRLLLTLFHRPPLPEWLRAHSRYVAAAIALLWTLHPLQTEVVMYVVQRTESMAATCILLALLFAVRSFERERTRNALFAALAIAVGTGCKATIVATPALVLCLDLAFFSPSLRAALSRHRSLYAGLAVALLPLLAFVLTAARSDDAASSLGMRPLDNLAVQGQAIAWYLSLVAWPETLSVTYNWPIDRALARYWLADLAMCALVVVTIYLSGRRSRASLPGWFFWLLIAPSSFVPILSELVAERRMYLPLAAAISVPILFVTRAIHARGASTVPATLAVVSCGALALACAVRSYVRANDYRSDEALFASALKTAPDNPQAMWGLARAYEKSDQPKLALDLYERMAAQPYPYVGSASWGTRGLMAKADLLEREGRLAAAAATRLRALDHHRAITSRTR